MEHQIPTYTKNFAALRDEVERRGWHRTYCFRILLEFIFYVCLLVAGGYGYLHSTGFLYHMLALVICTFASVGIASSSHTATHYAAFSSRIANQMLSFVGGPILLGLSATYWYDKHVIAHHRAPNVLGVDRDIDLSPWFCITDEQAQETRGLRRFWTNLQWLTAPIFISGLAQGMNLNGWIFLTRRAFTPRGFRLVHALDTLGLALHAIIWLSLPQLSGFSIMQILSLYFLKSAMLGYAFFAVLAPAHYPPQALSLRNRRENLKDQVMQVTWSTLNFKCVHPFGFFLCGLQYQIEHHLFPKVSHHHLPELATLVREYCRANNYPYRSLSWPRGILYSLLAFRLPKRVIDREDIGRSVRSGVSPQDGRHAEIASPVREQQLSASLVPW